MAGVREYLGLKENVPSEDLLAAFNHFDRNKNGTISIDEFLCVVLGEDQARAPTPEASEPESAAPQLSRQLSFSQVELIKRIREIFLQRSATSGKAVHRIINNFDDGNGMVEYPEFRNGVYSYLHGNDETIPDEDLKRVFDFFDKDGSGYISIDEFISVLMGALPLSQIGGSTADRPRAAPMRVWASSEQEANAPQSDSRFVPRPPQHVPLYGSPPSRSMPPPLSYYDIHKQSSVHADPYEPPKSHRDPNSVSANRFVLYNNDPFVCSEFWSLAMRGMVLIASGWHLSSERSVDTSDLDSSAVVRHCLRGTRAQIGAPHL